MTEVGNSKAARPWFRVACLGVDQVVAWGVLYYSYSVLSTPLANAFNVSTRLIALAFSLSLAISGFLAAPVGRILDRRGARFILLLGAWIGPLAFGALALAPSVWSLFCIFGALGIVQALALYEPAFQAVVEWFPSHAERSRALLLLTCIAGFSSTVFLPLTAWLVERLGWRSTIVVLSLLLAFVLVPFRFKLPRDARHDLDRPEVRARRIEEPRVLGMLGGAFGLQSLASTGAMLYLTRHFLELGQPLARAAFFAGLAGAAQVPGRLFLSPLQRSARPEVRLPLLFIAQALSLAAIAAGPWPLVVVAILVFGATTGALTLEKAVVVLQWCGADNYGTHSGFVSVFALVARAAAPIAAEALQGTLGSFAKAFIVLAVGVAAGSVLVLAASKVRMGRDDGST